MGEPRKDILWVIDPGHGPKTTGRRSPKLPPGSEFPDRRFYEYIFTRAVARELAALCESGGMQHTLTVALDDLTIGNSTSRRTAFENSLPADRPRVFVSIHSNASRVQDENTDWGAGNGLETWHFFRQGAPEHKGVQIARIVQRHLVEELGLADRGLRFVNDKVVDLSTGKRPRQFAVLRDTICPAVLVEIGFFNNLKEVQFLLRLDTPARAARALFNAFYEVETKLL